MASHSPLLLTCLVLVSLAIDAAESAGIEYAALGNFETDEGTLEVWFTPMTDLYPDLDKDDYRSIFQLFSLRVPGHFSFGAHWAARQNKVGLQVSINHATIRDGLYSLPAHGLKWQRGQKHHVAMTWSGREMKLWADGAQVSQRNQAAWFDGPVGNARLIIGHGEFRDTPIVLHAIRVSCAARSEADLRAATPHADALTLLLDRFDAPTRIAAGKTTVPDVISSITGEPGGQIKGRFHFVKQPAPGVALFAGKEVQKE